MLSTEYNTENGPKIEDIVIIVLAEGIENVLDEKGNISAVIFRVDDILCVTKQQPACVAPLESEYSPR